MSQPLAALKSLYLLEGLTDEQMTILAGIAECVRFSEREIIFREGDPATEVYFLMEGSVSLEMCSPGTGCHRILTLGPGELLGWSPALEQERLTATARAETAVSAVKINGRRLLALCDQDPRFGYQFMKRAALALARRLSATRLQVLNVYGESRTGPTVNAQIGGAQPAPEGSE